MKPLIDPVERAHQIHEQAMDLLESSLRLKKRGEEAQAKLKLEQAYEQESLAVSFFKAKLELEPLRSIILSSAANMASLLGKYQEAKENAYAAFAGSPPANIKVDLNELIQEANYYINCSNYFSYIRYKEVRLSIDSPSIFNGYIPLEHLLRRVDSLSTIVSRHIEMTFDLPFRDSGPPRTAIKKLSTPYIGQTATGSYQVTLMFGDNEQIPEVSETSKAIKSFLENAKLLSDDDYDALENSIPDQAYRRNFIGLMRQAAPDGELIKRVTVSGAAGGEQALTVSIPPKVKQAPLPLDPEHEKQITNPQVILIGYLSRAQKDRDQPGIIRLLGKKLLPQKILVPGELMKDVVGQYWESMVCITAVEYMEGNKKLYELIDIQPANDEASE